MKNTDLTNTYRELDRELAILHDQLESHRSFENILFLPTPEKIRSVREKWNDLTISSLRLAVHRFAVSGA